MSDVRLANKQAAVEATVVFLNHFKDLPDLHETGKMSDPLECYVLFCPRADPAGAEYSIKIARHRWVDGDHGCIETRTTTVIHEIV